jgi:hypothetical protein
MSWSKRRARNGEARDGGKGQKGPRIVSLKVLDWRLRRMEAGRSAKRGARSAGSSALFLGPGAKQLCKWWSGSVACVNLRALANFSWSFVWRVSCALPWC